jgi:hypothetical protein
MVLPEFFVPRPFEDALTEELPIPAKVLFQSRLVLIRIEINRPVPPQEFELAKNIGVQPPRNRTRCLIVLSSKRQHLMNKSEIALPENMQARVQVCPQRIALPVERFTLPNEVGPV